MTQMWRKVFNVRTGVSSTVWLGDPTPEDLGGKKTSAQEQRDQETADLQEIAEAESQAQEEKPSDSDSSVPLAGE